LLLVGFGIELMSRFRHAVTRADDGTAATTIGAALDLLAIADLEAVP
jgi:hypothetical protein